MARPSEVFAGERVMGTATGSNFNSGRTIQYNWSGTGVRVAGSDASSQVDTSDLAPGVYQVSANLSDGNKGNVASCMASFTVKQTHRPIIACASDPGNVRAGGTATIRSNANSPDDRRLTYSYTASAGSISGGDAMVTLNTGGAAPRNHQNRLHGRRRPQSVADRVPRCNDRDSGGAATTAASSATAAEVRTPTPLELRLALHSIYFQTALPTATSPNGGLLDSQQQTLIALARDFNEYLGTQPQAHLILEGHADPRGSARR